MDRVQFLFEDNGINVAAIINAALNLNRPNNQIEERERVVRNENYFEVTIPNYSDLQFREHFRMSRQTFQALLNEIGDIYNATDRIVPLDKKLLFSIWLLSKPESFLAAGDRFGLPKGYGHTIFNNMVNLICQLLQRYINWPENHVHTINVFRNRSRGIPGIVGAIDGRHIPIKQPAGNLQDYFNRKQFHSIILQGTCNERALFIDINVGQPGRMHDARVFRLSPLYQRLTDPVNPILRQDMHLIGDSAYPLLT
ncbi:DDE superfamily endonuclease [Popillia japonica]|uniref:DDE superfamily endonuclease n=1 Tax=Popillia japonica TaxID=7064 RepID=A0AAW1IDJ7_POPJA